MPGAQVQKVERWRNPIVRVVGPKIGLFSHAERHPDVTVCQMVVANFQTLGALPL